MELFRKNRVARGQVADVFVTGDPGLVCKLARAGPWPRWNEVAARAWRTEALAYDIARADQRLARHVPECRGVAAITRVVDDDGTDASDEYVLAAGLILGRVEVSSEEKAIRVARERYPHVGALLDRFAELNLETGDASALNFESSDTLRLVDFTTKAGAESLASYWWNHTPPTGG